MGFSTRGLTPFGLWLPVLLYIGFIFWISSVPRPVPGIERFPWIDKPLHSLEYAPLGSLLLRATLRTWMALAGGAAYVLSLAGGLCVGALDEFYQSFIPLKESDPLDVAWDLLGAAIGQGIFWVRFSRRG